MKINGISTAQSMSTEAISKDSRAVSPTENANIESVNPSADSMMPIKVSGNEDGGINEDLLQKSVDQANKNLQQYNRFIEREVHEVTHTVMYKLVDSTTNEVISEFPPKKIEDMIAKMWELAGLFVDEKA
ncbi:flagellar protein FlaG [Fusibacter paucivorans]|uniref:Flagellar protein FlaG n=1 Tax=Fusibacter paucivorans TaxID=76009 RepID=A0ABS5PN45_9FIRM|nr:flagellar protein FlaG [Fusibacter paucivorans]MBS7525786.1 flagellar protein FlaG [Fusibacter paucivorans]